MNATKKGCLAVLLFFLLPWIGFELYGAFSRMPWSMMRERSKQGYDKYYHETVVSVWGGKPPDSLRVVYAHDGREALDWLTGREVREPTYVTLRMKVDAADLLPWMEDEKFKRVFFHLPEYSKQWEALGGVDEVLWHELWVTGHGEISGKLKDAYCGFTIPYCLNAPAVVEAVTSPTLTLAVCCQRKLELPSERQNALDATERCLHNKWYEFADEINAMAKTGHSQKTQVLNSSDGTGKKSK
jgi:hypothetical protein